MHPILVKSQLLKALQLAPSNERVTLFFTKLTKIFGHSILTLIIQVTHIFLKIKTRKTIYVYKCF